MRPETWLVHEQVCELRPDLWVHMSFLVFRAWCTSIADRKLLAIVIAFSIANRRPQKVSQNQSLFYFYHRTIAIAEFQVGLSQSYRLYVYRVTPNEKGDRAIKPAAIAIALAFSDRAIKRTTLSFLSLFLGNSLLFSPAMNSLSF